jgi:hypothetical protein
MYDGGKKENPAPVKDAGLELWKKGKRRKPRGA